MYSVFSINAGVRRYFLTRPRSYECNVAVIVHIYIIKEKWHFKTYNSIMASWFEPISLNRASVRGAATKFNLIEHEISFPSN